MSVLRQGPSGNQGRREVILGAKGHHAAIQWITTKSIKKTVIRDRQRRGMKIRQKRLPRDDPLFLRVGLHKAAVTIVTAANPSA